jgi:hypothetical protein
MPGPCLPACSAVCAGKGPCAYRTPDTDGAYS